MIAEFGVYPDVPEEDYHTDRAITFGPTLSASGAKTLLTDPAAFAYERSHPKASTKAMDVGSVAHLLALGKGGLVKVIDCENWMSPKNRLLRDDAIAAGAIAVNRVEYAKAAAMANAVLEHPVAGPLFEGGVPEVSFWWVDPDTGVKMRGRADYLTEERIVDLKSAQDISPDGFAKACANYGYRESAANYRQGLMVLTAVPRDFVLVAVESSPPHRVAMYRFNEGDLEYGAARMAQARLLFRQYEAEGYPELYSTEIREIVMPAWANGDSTDPTKIRDVEAMPLEERY